MDLHTHTPASSDYEESRISYLDWLRVAADRGLDIVAITDHNTVAGVAAIRREIEWLTRLEQQNRLNDEERAALASWRELSNKVLVLPGFEFTATFGFHILGIFPPETSVRTLEHILLSLRVPPEKIDIGSTETGSATDVLTAYRVIREAGGLAIAAHANSTHGVAMRNFPFGGQTKIAYTQDVNLDALEVTDLEHRGYSTARFFNGSKTEYPRRMHSIQGSDAHRLTMDPRNPKRLGIGERATEVYLEDCSFEALAALLRSTAWDLIRPARPKERPFDALAKARVTGPGLMQSFHVSATKAGGNADAILADICAFANTVGGAVYVGVSLRRDGPQGLARPNQVEQQILEAVGERISPSLVVHPEIVKSDNASVLRLQVPKGDDRPHAVDGSKIWVREDKQTRAATRDEIVAMVLEVMEQQSVPVDADVAMIVEQQEAAVAAAPAAEEGDAPAAKPRARRSRRGGSRSSARKTAAPNDVEADSAPPATNEPAAVASHMQDGAGPDTGAASPKPPGEEIPEVVTPAVEAPDSALEMATPETAAAKPKARRTRTQKSVAAETAAPADAPVAEAAPKPKKAPRKSAAATRSASVESAPAESTDAESTDVESTDVESADAESADAVNSSAETIVKASAARKPATKRTTTTRKTTTRAKSTKSASSADTAQAAAAAEAEKKTATRKRTTKAKTAAAPAPVEIVLPQIGVEIVESEDRGGITHHSIRDLRNGGVIKGVTRRGARDLWNYAIRALEEKRFNLADAEWEGDVGLLHVEKRAGKMRYDLVMRTPEGARIFYGVTDEGMPGPWAQFVVDEEE
jgi:hypothetical protein